APGEQGGGERDGGGDGDGLQERHEVKLACGTGKRKGGLTPGMRRREPSWAVPPPPWRSRSGRRGTTSRRGGGRGPARLRLPAGARRRRPRRPGRVDRRPARAERLR